MASREAFLRKISSRLHDRVPQEDYSPTHATDVPWTRSGGSGKEPAIEDAPDRFLAELAALGGHGERVAGPAEARDYILELAASLRSDTLLRWDDAELDLLGVDEPLRRAGVEVAVWSTDTGPRDTAARADIGLTTAEYAVAETGSIAVSGAPGKGRSVTLLPPVHVAVLPAERVLGTVSEWLGRYAEEARLPANVSLHSGPSRSGDIEQILTIGVHGPGDVHVLLVG